tara:strand:- start:1647 stop:1853 length:207 start_codon:yes stop_codon:yes gene_type:complete
MAFKMTGFSPFTKKKNPPVKKDKKEKREEGQEKEKFSTSMIAPLGSIKWTKKDWEEKMKLDKSRINKK